MIKKKHTLFIDQVINDTFNHLYDLLDCEKININQYLENKRKPKYIKCYLFKLTLFISIAIFELINFDFIIIALVPIGLLIILLFLDSNIFEILNYYNYSVFSKNKKFLTLNLKRIELIVKNYFLIRDKDKINNIIQIIKEITQELNTFDETIKSKIFLIDKYKIFEIIIIIITIFFSLIQINIDFSKINIVNIIITLYLFGYFFIFGDYLNNSIKKIYMEEWEIGRNQITSKAKEHLECNYIILREFLKSMFLPKTMKLKNIDELVNANTKYFD